jgi:hypothetical protein
VTWGGKLYWTQEPPAEEHAPVEGSFVEFYVNGESLGRFQKRKKWFVFSDASVSSPASSATPRVCVASSSSRGSRYPPACEPWIEARAVRACVGAHLVRISRRFMNTYFGHERALF